MTDTDILNRLISVLKIYARHQSPVSPLNCANLVECAEADRGCKREPFFQPEPWKAEYDLDPKTPLQDMRGYETTAVIENHGLPGQRTVRTMAPVSDAWVGPEYIDERLLLEPKTEVVVGNARQKQYVANPVYQNFWRCTHHPEAIANWSHGTGWFCSQGCDESELKWWDGGTNTL